MAYEIQLVPGLQPGRMGAHIWPTCVGEPPRPYVAVFARVTMFAGSLACTTRVKPALVLSLFLSASILFLALSLSLCGSGGSCQQGPYVVPCGSTKMASFGISLNGDVELWALGSSVIQCLNSVIHV